MIAVTMARTDASGANATGEPSYLLQQAGTILPSERVAAVAAEYVIFRDDVDVVNNAYSPTDKPSLIFVTAEG